MSGQRLERAKAVVTSEREWIEFVHETGEYGQLCIERALLTNGMFAAVVESEDHTKLSLYDDREMVAKLRGGEIPDASTEHSLHEGISVQ